MGVVRAAAGVGDSGEMKITKAGAALLRRLGLEGGQARGRGRSRPGARRHSTNDTLRQIAFPLLLVIAFEDNVGTQFHRVEHILGGRKEMEKRCSE